MFPELVVSSVQPSMSSSLRTKDPAPQPRNDDDDDDKNSAVLTPLRAHYLKKALIQLQFGRELDLITAETPPNVSTLSYLGQPFTNLPKDVPRVDLPFLKYIFRQFVLTFPFMAAAPKDFYSQKLQPFLAVLISRNLRPISALDDKKGENVLQTKIIHKLERNLTLFLGSATRLVEKEEVVNLTQADLTRLEALTEKRQRRRAKSKDIFDVNIVSVRAVVEKGRVRNRGHEEFIIRTRRSRYPDVYVSRRYGDFRTLYQELNKAHPEEDVRPPPAKDRSFIKAPVLSPTSPSPPDPSSVAHNSSSSANFDHNSPSPNQHPTSSTPKLAREKNRLTLRSYLHSLLSSSTIASSPVIRSFLLSGPTTLSESELEDAKRREEIDKLREEGRTQFAKEIAVRIDALRDAVKHVKGDIMGKDGLSHFFSVVKLTPIIHNLPPNYHSVVEWGRVSLASTVYQTFVASDDASETFAGLKRIHGLMPYFMLKAALKITNPVSMIRNVMDLFLATPFGGKSLLQRMFTSSLTEEVRFLEEEIKAVMDKVDDPVMCTKIRQFVYAPRDIQNMLKNDAKNQQMNIITMILRSAESPVLSRSQMQRLTRAHKAHMIYLRQREKLEDSDDDEGPQDEDAWLIEDLKVLAHLYSSLKDKEDLINLIFEGFTADLLKDILTIFYTPLAKVYRAANIANSLGDLQNFISDLIKTVEAVDDSSQDDTHATVQAFIDLVQRHEQAFYSFVHNVHSKGEGLFKDLMHWIDVFLTVIRESLGEPISLEFLLPHTGLERDQIMSEIDRVALYHYKLKVLYEEKLRRRFVRAQGNSYHSSADAEDEAAQELLDNIVAGELNFGDLVSGDAIDLAAQVTDEESSSEEYSSSEEDTDSEAESSSSQDEKMLTPKKSPMSPPVQPSHQQYFQNNRIPVEQRGTNSSKQAVRRHRSLSLKSVRSLISFNNNSRRSQDTPPPVPSVPAMDRSAAPFKPPPQKQHPLSPISGPEPITPIKASPLQQIRLQPQQNGKQKSMGRETLKPPELHFIPQLLPVFVEMMRPSLHVRQT